MPLLPQIFIGLPYLRKPKNPVIDHGLDELLVNKGIHFPKLLPRTQQESPRRTEICQTVHD